MTEDISKRPLIPMPKTPLQRFGCGVLLVIWFAILLLPFGMFWLAMGNSFKIPRTNIPDAATNPRLEISLIMDKDNRGLHIFTSAVYQTEAQLCIEGHSTYLLWESKRDDNNAVYCQCYEAAGENWNFINQTNSICE